MPVSRIKSTRLIRWGLFNCYRDFLRMVLKCFRRYWVCATVFVCSCSFSADSLLPTLTGEDPTENPSSPQPAQTPQTSPSSAPASQPQSPGPTPSVPNTPSEKDDSSDTFIILY